jgi:hypothetical protein
MNKEDFIGELISKTGLTQEQGNAANDVFESTFLAGNESKDLIVGQLVERVGVDKSQAEMIYTVGIGLLSSGGVMDKVKGIFK